MSHQTFLPLEDDSIDLYAPTYDPLIGDPIQPQK